MTAGCFEQADSHHGATVIYTGPFAPWATVRVAPPLDALLAKGTGVPVKILVCMKQVPQKDAPLKLNESGTWIREDLSYEVNEPDAFALEEALRSWVAGSACVRTNVRKSVPCTSSMAKKARSPSVATSSWRRTRFG